MLAVVADAVTELKRESGARGHMVYKFKLERCPDQPPLRNNASAAMHKRLVELSERDGSITRVEKRKEDELQGAQKA